MRNRSPIAFRPADIRDIPLIRDLATRIWRDHYPGIISRSQIDYMLEKMYTADVLRREIGAQGYRYIIAQEEDRPVGFIAYAHEPAEQAVRISKLYLLPELHGKGLGQQMLGCVKDDAQKMGAVLIYLFVNKNNTKAITAYERFGFFKAEAVANDIGNGFVMDDFRMALRL